MGEPSLREQIEASVKQVVSPEPSGEAAPAAAPVIAPAPEAPQGDDRPRDAQGRFVKTQAEQDAEAASVKAAQAAPDLAPASRSRPAYPSHWKRDYESLWGKVPDELLPMIEYAAVQREQEYQKGVSTYKQEADRARSLMEALNPFVPLLQQHNIRPEQWISNLGNAHRVLATASPQEKIQMFAKLAQDYRVPLEYLLNPQAMQALQSVPPMQQAPDVRSLVRSEYDEREAERTAQAFVKEAPQKYPHYEEVKDTMVQLLGSAMAQDLPDAYQKALRLNDDLWAKEQAAQAATREAERKRAAEDAAKKARAAAVSPKSASPSGTATPAGGDKSLRSMYEEQASSLGGRV